MNTNKQIYFHGSDLEKIAELYGINKEEIISFSANVNPLGISYRLKEHLAEHIDAVTSYPDREYKSLRMAIAEYVHESFHHIIVGNGSTELISLVIRCLHPKKALLLGPTYSEYEHELRLSGSRFKYFNLKEENDFTFVESDFKNALSDDVELLVICNPNNPTSSLISKEEMKIILTICKEKHVFVMIDETYIEFCENPEKETAISLTGTFDNVIVLRGISKFFAAPGLRLGYGICGNSAFLSRMTLHKRAWTIGSLTAVAGEIMLKDTDYIKDTRQLISHERSRICHRLDNCKAVKYYPAHANFILFRILRKDITSTMLFKAAILEKMMVRDCASFDALGNQYIRFCFMKPEQNDRLLDVFLERLGSR